MSARKYAKEDERRREIARAAHGVNKTKCPLRVIVESPLGTNFDGSMVTRDELARNVEYARQAMIDCFRRGEAPYASHLLYPQIFDDAQPEERRAGMLAGFAWGEVGTMAALYVDYGMTDGMRDGQARHESNGLEIVERRIGFVHDAGVECNGCGRKWHRIGAGFCVECGTPLTRIGGGSTTG